MILSGCTDVIFQYHVCVDSNDSLIFYRVMYMICDIVTPYPENRPT
jgi:hypothetical protein